MKYDDLVGVPFKLNGKDKNGMDCYNLLQELYSRKGINLPNFASTDDVCLAHQMIFQEKILWEELEKPEPDCVVLFTITPPYVSHLGIVLADCKRFIHAHEKAGVAIESLNHPLWRKKIKGYLKWKN